MCLFVAPLDSPKIHNSFTHPLSDLSIVTTMRRGFVIQLHSETDHYPVRFAGRVEHVDSGRADGFRSVEELVRFIQETVQEIEQTERGEIQEPLSEN